MSAMNSKPEKPLRLFVNLFAIWTGLAFKTGEAMLASMHAAAARECPESGRDRCQRRAAGEAAQQDKDTR